MSSVPFLHGRVCPPRLDAPPLRSRPRTAAVDPPASAGSVPKQRRAPHAAAGVRAAVPLKPPTGIRLCSRSSRRPRNWHIPIRPSVSPLPPVMKMTQKTSASSQKKKTGSTGRRASGRIVLYPLPTGLCRFANQPHSSRPPPPTLRPPGSEQTGAGRPKGPQGRACQVSAAARDIRGPPCAVIVQDADDSPLPRA